MAAMLGGVLVNSVRGAKGSCCSHLMAYGNIRGPVKYQKQAFGRAKSREVTPNFYVT